MRVRTVASRHASHGDLDIHPGRDPAPAFHDDFQRDRFIGSERPLEPHSPLLQTIIDSGGIIEVLKDRITAESAKA